MSKKLSLVNTSASSLKEVWECFIISKTSKCVSDATLSNYHHHLRAIAKHLDIEMPLEELSKRHLERMVVSMKEAGFWNRCGTSYTGWCIHSPAIITQPRKAVAGLLWRIWNRRDFWPCWMPFPGMIPKKRRFPHTW